MKQMILTLLAICNIALAQQPLSLSTDKTTSLIFPLPISHVDRGTTQIITQPVKGQEQILLVKAAAKNFTPTSLSVVTNDGTVYSFLVQYDSVPKTLVIELPLRGKGTIAIHAQAILDNKPEIRNLRWKKGAMNAAVTGVYVKDKVLYYQLLICNHSPIDFDVDVLRFFIRDQQKGKRTASQEIDCVPIHVAGNAKTVKAYDFTVVVVALNQFTIPHAKFLGIQLQEKNGGRNFLLKVRNQVIMKAVVLPDLY